ncbi:MAG: hypothetical protein U9O94_08750, partial [Nanoarchaeota archaeon]|nr:hypothetical protein [Nanoarchaeota archaeon]
MKRLNLLLLVLLISFASAAYASDLPPAIPFEFFGQINIDSQVATDGTIIAYQPDTFQTTTVAGWYYVIIE